MNMIMKKNMYTESIALCAVLFFVPLYCMDEPAVSPFLTKEIIDTEIKPRFSLQDMSRFSRTGKHYKNCFDLEKMCVCDKNNCSTCACARLRKCHYDVRTKVLVHYAQTQNQAMFAHVWSWEENLRKSDFGCTVQIGSKDPWSFENKIRVYCKYYSNQKKIEKTRMKQLISALNLRRYKDNEYSVLLKKVLPGSDFNIFDNAYRKKRRTGVRANLQYTRHIIIRETCELDDVDLLLAILGGFVEPRAFKYVFEHAEPQLLSRLADMEAFPDGVTDKRGKDALYYARNYISPSERRENEYRGPLLH